MKKIAGAVKGISHWLGAFTTFLSVPIMTSFLLLIFIGVLSRFVFSIPILATDELAQIGFVWACFFGAADAFKKKTNIIFMMVLHKVSDKTRYIMNVCIYLICIGFFICMGFYGTHITVQVFENRYAISNLSMSITYITIPVTMLIMIFHALSFIVEETEQYKRVKGGKAV